MGEDPPRQPPFSDGGEGGRVKSQDSNESAPAWVCKAAKSSGRLSLGRASEGFFGVTAPGREANNSRRRPFARALNQATGKLPAVAKSAGRGVADRDSDRKTMARNSRIPNQIPRMG